MKYPNGVAAKLGDRVRFSNGEIGTIVASIDTNEYSSKYSEEEWKYLKNGVMIRTDKGAIVHFEDPNVEEIFLLD